MKTKIAAVMLALTFGSLIALAGCHSDPHDTHVIVRVTSLR